MSDQILQVLITAIGAIVVAIIGARATVMAARVNAGQEPEDADSGEQPKPDRPSRGRILAGAAAVVVGLVGAGTTACQSTGTPDLPPGIPTPVPVVVIDSPEDGARVPDPAVQVSGRWQHVPDDLQLWVVVYPMAALRYYPQERYQVHFLENGTWNGRAYAGTAADPAGSEYQIFVGLADADAHRELMDYMDQHPEWGMTELPDGFQLFADVTVFRE